MTFNPSIPLNSDSPSIFPAQSQTNYTRLQTLIGADHQFNNTAADNDGYHKLIHMTIQAPTGDLTSTGRSYVKLIGGRVHQFYMDDAGTEYQITPTMPIRAAVNFNAIGVDNGNPCPLRSFYNITSVIKNSTGVYTVNFTTDMPNTNYIVQITGMRNEDKEVLGFVLGNATYSSSVGTNSVKIKFIGESSPRDVIMGNVTVFSVT